MGSIAAKGTEEDILYEFDLLLSWWMALGIPLAWNKGKIVWDGAPPTSGLE